MPGAGSGPAPAAAHGQVPELASRLTAPSLTPVGEGMGSNRNLAKEVTKKENSSKEHDLIQN